MKIQFKTTIIYAFILSGFLSSCKKQDGYSDEVTTTQKTIDSTQTASDSVTTNNTATPSNTPAGAGEKTAPNTGAESTNAGNQESGSNPNEAKGTGTGSGPGLSSKDGAAYSGPSDPQNSKIKTTKSKSAKNNNK